MSISGKTKISEAVKKLFLEGKTDFSSREIAEKAKVSKALIFHSFGSKEALELTVSREMVNYFLDNISKVQDEHLDAEAKLNKLVIVFFEMASEGQHFLNFLLSRSLAKNKDYIEVSNHAGDGIFKILLSTVHQGVDEGIFHDKDAENIAFILLRFLHSGIVQKALSCPCKEFKDFEHNFAFLINKFKK